MIDDANAVFLAQIRRGQQPLPPAPDDQAEIPTEKKRGVGRPKGARNKVNNNESRGERRASVSLSTETWKRLRILAVNRETTSDALIREGIEYVFKRYSTGPVASTQPYDDVVKDDEPRGNKHVNDS